MRPFSRREFVLAGVTGGAAGIAAYQQFHISATIPEGANVSFAHSGEDVIVRLFLGDGGKLSYLDVGACWPIFGNNTYLFYNLGSRGVLIEPNVALIPELKAKRPRDLVLNIGIGVEEQNEADFYCYSEPLWNTFDTALVEKRTAISGFKPEKVVKMPLVPINRVIEEHLGGKAPDFLTIDVEGLDLAILKTLDFDRFRSKVICAETMDEDWRRALPVMAPAITDFLTGKGYEPRAMTYYNTIYIDKKAFS